jgi:DNA-binding transcriptional regulator YiaG
MPNLAAVLKEEIRRLARQEARAEVAAVRRSSGQYRRDIAALKRELAEARRKLAVLESELRRRREAASPDADAADSRRWSPRGLKAHRKRLGLSALDYGALVGVTGKTIYSWEQGGQRPRAAQLAAIVAIRGLGKRAALARLGGNTTPANGHRRPRAR